MTALMGGVAGIIAPYVMIRMMIALLPAVRDMLDPSFTLMAVLVLLAAPLGALARERLRSAIGFLAIGNLGAVFAGLAVPTLRGVAGATFYSFHAMLTVSALFMLVGLVERASGVTSIRRMGGICRHDSLISVLFLLLIAAMAGLPPFLGFWPRLLMSEAALSQLDWTISAAVLVNGLLTLFVGARLWALVFWRGAQDGSPSPAPFSGPFGAPGSRMALATTLLLTALIVLFGLLPNLLFDTTGIAAGELLRPQLYMDAAGLATPADLL